MWYILEDIQVLTNDKNNTWSNSLRILKVECDLCRARKYFKKIKQRYIDLYSHEKFSEYSDSCDIYTGTGFVWLRITDKPFPDLHDCRYEMKNNK